MTIWQAVILGIIQGLTEFLPISSSGHLVIFQHLFGLTEPELIFDISVHVGTLAAVIIFFKTEILSIIASVFHYLSYAINRRTIYPPEPVNPNLRWVWLIIIGSVPTALIGLLIKKQADVIFSSVFLVGVMLLITGLLLFITRWVINKTPSDDTSSIRFSAKDAVIIGIVQGIAVMPGISRSGSTIAAGLFLGLNRETAARFSFLLSIPAILGAELLSIKDMLETSGSLDMTIVIGALTAGLSGFGALKLLMFIIKKGKLHFFAPYCFIAGAAALWIAVIS